MTKEAIVEFDNARLFGSLYNNQEILAIYIDSLKIAIDEDAGPEAISKVAEAINRVLMVMMEATSIIGQADNLVQDGDPNVIKAPDIGPTDSVTAPGIVCGWNPEWNSEFDNMGNPIATVSSDSPVAVDVSVNDPRDLSIGALRHAHCTCDYPEDRKMKGHAEHCDYAFKAAR